MCLPPANARICPNSLLYSAVYHRYSLKSFQLCKSAQTYWYRKYFEHIVARFQGDSSCLTIDNIKPELCRNSAPLYNPMFVVGNSAPLFFHSSHFNCNDNKSNPLSRVLKENINKIYKMQHSSTLGNAAYSEPKLNQQRTQADIIINESNIDNSNSKFKFKNLLTWTINLAIQLFYRYAT